MRIMKTCQIKIVFLKGIVTFSLSLSKKKKKYGIAGCKLRIQSQIKITVTFLFFNSVAEKIKETARYKLDINQKHIFLLMVLQKKQKNCTFFFFSLQATYITTIILFQTAKHTCVHTLV